MNMRIVYTAPRYHTNQHFVMKALIEAGHEVSFLALTRGQSEEYSAFSPTVLGYSRAYDLMRRLLGKLIGKDFVRIPSGGGIPSGGIPPIPRFLNEIRRLRPTVMVVRDPSSTYGRLSILAAIATRARLILYSQEPISDLTRNPPRTYRFLDRSRLSPGFAWMTPVSDPAATGSENATLPSSNKILYIPFIIEPQTAPPDKRWFARDTVNILSIGKFQLRKNHGLFLKVVARLSKRHHIRSTIIGECSTPDHQKALSDVERCGDSLGIRDKLEIKTNLPFSEVQQEYRKHDVFVLASSDEPAAVSPLEAMSHSLPVICSDSNGTMCYIRHGENGFVFCDDDADDLERCLERILTDRKRLTQMGCRSHELVVSEHSPERYVNTLVNLVSSQK